VRLHKEVWCKI